MLTRVPDRPQRFLWRSLAVVAGLSLLTMSCSSSAPSTTGSQGASSGSSTGSGTSGGTAGGDAGAPAAKKPDIQLKVPETIPLTQPTPALSSGAAPSTGGAPATGASPVAKSASPAASPAAATRTEPKGKFTYYWHTAAAPSWFDPQENPALLTIYAFQYIMHDALVRPMPGNVFSPSLAESYEVAPDQKSATFKLRPGIKFHNGDPVTPEDVKWTFENYKGANAKVLKDKVTSIEIPDARTVKFVFKDPFPDFLLLYGTTASGAGWIVPKKYYEQVGPNGFKQNPIGAGPFKLVKQSPDTWEFEAVPDYWRKSPGIKTLVLKTVTEDATRLAAIQAGEADIINSIPGSLIETVRNDPKLKLIPTQAATFWLEFPGHEKPTSPFNKKQVREAVALALDRQALSEAESAGFSKPANNWIANDWPGAIQGPEPKYDLARAKQLMAEAGYPNGFDIEQLTPLPPYNSLAERVIGQLREIGIRTKLNTMERAAFATKLEESREAIPGIILNISGLPGDAASRVRTFATCTGPATRICYPDQIDAKMKAYDASTDPKERERLITEIQQFINENQLFVPVYRLAFFIAVGQRVQNEATQVIANIPQYIYVGPYEDIMVKD